ncbi:MAG: AI-2E family transporter [Limisphaerales bacterium]
MAFRPLQIRYLGYWLVFLMLIMAGWLDLATPLLAVLFSFFTLTKLRIGRNKIFPAIVFVVLVLGISYLFGYFIKQAVDALPNVLADSFPKVVAYADSHGWITADSKEALDELKHSGLNYLKAQLGYLANFAKIATKEFAFLIIGIVVAISLFFNSQIDLDRGRHAVKNNLYSFACDEILTRFRSFNESFNRVMGAQIIISTLNTGFTAVYIIAIDLPYGALVIALTFLCGLLPIVGNLISNTVIVALSFQLSPKLAIASLVFLVLLHKLEYFLNSKIIGDRIKNPVWLTLLALIIGERLMGIPGMILAPVVLNFIKVEASTIEVPVTKQGGREELEAAPELKARNS